MQPEIREADDFAGILRIPPEAPNFGATHHHPPHDQAVEESGRLPVFTGCNVDGLVWRTSPVRSRNPTGGNDLATPTRVYVFVQRFYNSPEVSRVHVRHPLTEPPVVDLARDRLQRSALVYSYKHLSGLLFCRSLPALSYTVNTPNSSKSVSGGSIIKRSSTVMPPKLAP